MFLKNSFEEFSQRGLKAISNLVAISNLGEKQLTFPLGEKEEERG